MTDYAKEWKSSLENFSSNLKIDNKIPDKMPKLTPNEFNTDPFAYEKEYILKKAYNKFGMFGFVSWKWVNPFAEWIGDRKCLEVMAGRGWLSYALREKGIDVIATDNFFWHNTELYSSWKDIVTPIENLDAVTSVEKYGSQIDILIMSWAYTDNTAYEVIHKLHEVNPKALVVYIGEGKNGVTANDVFFAHFEEIRDKEFKKASDNYEQWQDVWDELKLGRFREKY